MKLKISHHKTAHILTSHLKGQNKNITYNNWNSSYNLALTQEEDLKDERQLNIFQPASKTMLPKQIANNKSKFFNKN